MTIECESLVNDIDFRLTLTRAKFDDLCLPIFSRLVPPIFAVLNEVNLTSEQIYEVVLAGGSTSILKV